MYNLYTSFFEGQVLHWHMVSDIHMRKSVHASGIRW